MNGGEAMDGTRPDEGVGADAGSDADSDAGSGGGPAAPVVRVTRGNASTEDVAALVVVLSAMGAGDSGGPADPPSAWGAPARVMRAPRHAGPGGWQASALPS